MIKIIRKYYLIIILILLSCDKPITESDSNELLPKSSFNISDFEKSDNCKSCHPNHYEQWSRSAHYLTSKSEKFFKDWIKEQNKRPDSGEDFCAQCHLPVAYLTDEVVGGYDSPNKFIESDLPAQLTDAISCSFCHSMVNTSGSMHTDPTISGDVAAVAEYFLFPGAGVQFGSIADPVSNSYHESAFNPIYSESEVCLPCHNHVIRNNLIETTFSEWNSNSFVAMTGEPSCQSCHMQEYIGYAAIGSKERTVHNHNFVGVSTDFSLPINPLSQSYIDSSELLKSALEVQYRLKDSILYSMDSDYLNFSVSINNLTAHNIPTGNAFVREAWLEFIVVSNQDTIFTSGEIKSNSSDLPTSNDENLLVFTSYLLDQSGNPTNAAADAYDFISTQLPTYGSIEKIFRIPINRLEPGSNIDISSRMLFRPYKPELLRDDHPHLLNNIPIYEMFSITETYVVGEVTYGRQNHE